MDDAKDAAARTGAKGKSKGKGGGVAPPPPKAVGGPPKVAPAPLKVKVRSAADRQEPRATRLHPTAAPQLLAVQASDGHFEAKTLLLKLDRLWSKLMVCAAPADARDDLDGDAVDATVFVIGIFEHVVEKTGSHGEARKAEVIKWFGSGSFLADRWLEEALAWVAARRPAWREERTATVRMAVEKWFATDVECTLPSHFLESDHLQQARAGPSAEELERRAAEAQAWAARERRWATAAVADVRKEGGLDWEAVSTIAWCFGGSGGAYLVRLGDSKLLVKACQDEGDILAHDFALRLQVCVPAMRALPVASAEFAAASKALSAVAPEEPGMPGRIRGRLLKMLARLRETGCPLLVIEFVPGEALPDPAGSEALLRGEAALLASLGRLIGLDMLMNNWDRLPAVRTWPSAGNLGNVLVNAAGQSVAIDQSVQLLLEAKQRVAYYEALHSFADEVAQRQPGVPGVPWSMHVPGEGMARVRQAVQAQVMKRTGDAARDAKMYEQFLVNPEAAWGVELDSAACQHILEGVHELFSSIGSIRSEFAAQRQAMVDRANSAFVEVDEARTHARRIEACMVFLDECMATVESQEAYQTVLQLAAGRQLDLPGRKIQPTV